VIQITVERRAGKGRMAAKGEGSRFENRAPIYLIFLGPWLELLRA
jgi:hypothetical protein